MTKISILSILVLISCSTKKQAGYSHLLEEKVIKSKQIDNLPIKFQFFRESETNCKIYYQINPAVFLSMRDSSGKWSREIGLELKVKANQFGGSGILELKKDTIVFNTEIVCDSFSFELPIRKDVQFELGIFDRNKHVFQNYSSYWERDAEFIPEDFLIEKGSFVAFGKAMIRKNSNLNNELSLEIYQNIFSPAERMYSISESKSTLDVKPEIEFIGEIDEVIKLVNELKVESYCRLSPVETDEKKSKRKFQFTIQANSINYSIAPLTYLLNDGLEKNVAPTINDWTQFWFRASNNDAVKAERLIQEFQRRVKYANDNFGSYKSGWQTDRGMLYVLLGEPDRIQNDIRGENWLYGFAEVNSKQFLFHKNISGLNGNDFVLERGLFYREIWQAAILKWENGWVAIDGR